ncbi:uncharacterized protein SPSK_04606 [Sporothrix schenckii 1099-18]|uniref:Uncharacterized protein n=1 Tax=Sporothrix schenckii 1099-18 TaxID=1397361 RepID=A0A0F2M5T1_SPOSC|nr:uncharacterized protein SPSK_04606 [Sporothrix schenckii 1099-18]KJR83541.1 hypothetical protein SPSK_04606 [Sporothrix schenckii 1099-18]
MYNRALLTESTCFPVSAADFVHKWQHRPRVPSLGSNRQAYPRPGRYAVREEMETSSSKRDEMVVGGRARGLWTGDNRGGEGNWDLGEAREQGTLGPPSPDASLCLPSSCRPLSRKHQTQTVGDERQKTTKDDKATVVGQAQGAFRKNQLEKAHAR